MPFYYCKLITTGGEVWAIKGILAERLYVPHSARCNYKWCHTLLGRYIFYYTLWIIFFSNLNQGEIVKGKQIWCLGESAIQLSRYIVHLSVHC